MSIMKCKPFMEQPITYKVRVMPVLAFILGNFVNENRIDSKICTGYCQTEIAQIYRVVALKNEIETIKRLACTLSVEEMPVAVLD